MKFTDQLARRAIVLLLILTLANLVASYDALRAVHRLEATINAQTVETTATANHIDKAAKTLCAISPLQCQGGVNPSPPLVSPLKP